MFHVCGGVSCATFEVTKRYAKLFKKMPQMLKTGILQTIAVLMSLN